MNDTLRETIELAEKLVRENKDKKSISYITKIEPYTRDHFDMTDALSFEVHDPFWLLARQWQFGEFKANDCGTPILTKIKLRQQRVKEIKKGNGIWKEFNNEVPIEADVERLPTIINEQVKIESAMRFISQLKYSSITKENQKKILKKLQALFPLENQFENKNTKNKVTMAELRKKSMSDLEKYLQAYSRQVFDAYKLFCQLERSNKSSILALIPEQAEKNSLAEIFDEFSTWFKKSYPTEANSAWDKHSMSYNLALIMDDKNEDTIFEAEQYKSGDLNWYSFDAEKRESMVSEKRKTGKEKFYTYVPTPLVYDGMPSKRLWEFENSKVDLGYNIGKNSIANVLMMQFSTMYSNDWLITPMEIELGSLSEIESIVVSDVFGEKLQISKKANETITEAESKKTTFSNKWEMFSCSRKEPYLSNNFSTDSRLFFPPAIVKNIESEAIEELQFLRDEMSNMVWGVENFIDQGCGIPMRGTEFSANLEEQVDLVDFRIRGHEGYLKNLPEGVNYSYIFQNTVPFHWIPLMPTRIKTTANKPGEIKNYFREICFQRATMPFYFYDNYVALRPNNSFLRSGIDENDKVWQHLYINEEEVLAMGKKLIKTNQRTRWFNGTCHNWSGYKSIIGGGQAASGLEFDALKARAEKGKEEKQ